MVNEFYKKVLSNKNNYSDDIVALAEAYDGMSIICDKQLMDDAVSAGDSVLLNEQAALLRECRAALDDLITKKKGIESLVCGSTTLGNLRAELCKYRPSAVFNT